MKIDIKNYKKIVFFTGAGMSAESGVPTYRGKGGVWAKYNYEEYACEEAFNQDPQKVLKFHELRRQAILECKPHNGHKIITNLQEKHNDITIITQNIDGMHQRANSKNVIELHGSIWRLRCENDGIIEDFNEKYKSYKCEKCSNYLRPDIIWFGDALNSKVTEKAIYEIASSNLFISIGTSGVVFPAAGFPQYAKENNAFCIEINPEENLSSKMYDYCIRKSASKGLEELFEN